MESKMFGKKYLAAEFLAVCTVGSANAGVIVGPVGATATNEFSATFDIGNTIDQSGLSLNYVSLVTNFESYIASMPSHSLLAAGLEWFTEGDVLTATVVYDLGAVYDIYAIALWNEEFSGFGQGDISTSVDGMTFTALTTINPTDNPDGSDYLPEVFSTVFTAQYVQIEVSGCPQLPSPDYS
jgi:hypothetical protein